jgi:hypothetical protein
LVMLTSISAPLLLFNTTRLNLVEDSIPFDITLSILASNNSNWIGKSSNFFQFCFNP